MAHADFDTRPSSVRFAATFSHWEKDEVGDLFRHDVRKSRVRDSVLLSQAAASPVFAAKARLAGR